MNVTFPLLTALPFELIVAMKVCDVPKVKFVDGAGVTSRET
jgi:hypothetical protein